MLASLKRKWLERLRTGKKATGALKGRNGGYCCLGHLALAAGEEFTPYPSVTGPTCYILDGQAAVLSCRMLDKFGLTLDQQGELVALNDGTTGFGEVIEYIEKNVKVER